MSKCKTCVHWLPHPPLFTWPPITQTQSYSEAWISRQRKRLCSSSLLQSLLREESKQIKDKKKKNYNMLEIFQATTHINDGTVSISGIGACQLI